MSCVVPRRSSERTARRNHSADPPGWQSAGGLLNPEGMVFHNGDLYVASQGTNQIIEYNGLTGAFVQTFVSGGAGGISLPNGLTLGPDGNLYVATQGSDSILTHDGTTGAFLATFTSGPSSGLSAPSDLVFEANGNLLVAGGSGDVLSYTQR
jgi:DNA-binding beta-propeller fold protein YncE